MVSEEEEDAVIVDKPYAGKFAIAFDPLDGSANLDANVSVGSIFSIWPKKSAGDLVCERKRARDCVQLKPRQVRARPLSSWADLAHAI